VSAKTQASDAEQLFLANLPLLDAVINFVVRRYHMSLTDAEDFASHVKIALIDHDYALLRKFEGRSTLKTFLTVVVTRMLLDYRIRAWGKWRPSIEAKRMGPVAVLLEQLTSRDRHSFDEACQILLTNHQVPASRAEQDGMAARLPIRMMRRLDPDDALEHLPAADSAEDSVRSEESRIHSSRVLSALDDVMHELQTQDRLILTLRFIDGRKVVEIAAILRIEAKVLYRRVDSLLGQLRKALEARGVEASVVGDLLQDGLP